MDVLNDDGIDFSDILERPDWSDAIQTPMSCYRRQKHCREGSRLTLDTRTESRRLSLMATE